MVVTNDHLSKINIKLFYFSYSSMSDKSSISLSTLQSSLMFSLNHLFSRACLAVGLFFGFASSNYIVNVLASGESFAQSAGG